mgnify:CR=1 FL=1
MQRVLHIINGMQTGGAEAYIMNLYRNINRDEIQFDFLLRDGNLDSDYISEIKSYGGKVIMAPPFPGRMISNYRFTKSFIESHDEYTVIEVHANALIYVFPFLIVHKIKRDRSISIIAHSHNTQTAKKIFSIVHFANRKFIYHMMDMRLACSEDAGKWMFGSGYRVIPNAINIEKWVKVPNAIKYSAKITLVQVARFLPVKNHIFTLHMFAELIKIVPDAELILIGEGMLEDKVKDLVNKLGLNGKVTFTGAISNVQDYVKNATFVLLPSLYEGIPVSLIEAQAAGTPCIISDKVDMKVDCSGHVYSLSIEDGYGVWINTILDKQKRERYDAVSRLKTAGYDVKQNAILVTRLYKELELKHRG